MPGAPDPLYAKAREVLLDALEALGPHRSSLVLVGAQAIYLHTGEADIAVAPFTTDADVIIDPGGLADHPIIGEALQASGFLLGDQPGQWVKDDARVLRLLRGVSTEIISQRLRGLRQDSRSAAVTGEALQHLEGLFARPEAAGSTLASRAAAGLEPEDTIRASCAALTEEVLSAL